MSVGSFQMRPRLDEPLTRQRVKSGTFRRIFPYVGQHRWALIFLIVATTVDAAITTATPLILRWLIDDGIERHRSSVVLGWADTLAVLAVLDAGALYLQAWLSGRVGEGLVYALRTKVYDHVQHQPLAFFGRARTGALVSRLNSDVRGAQEAVSTVLTQGASTVLTIVFTLVAMFSLSWQLSALMLILLPAFFGPGKLVSRRIQRLARQEMQLDAELGALMNERFDISGATLVKLYGRLTDESGRFTNRAAQVRDVAVATGVTARIFVIIVTMLVALTSAVVYGVGGELVIHGVLQLGTLVAMTALLLRFYSPLNQLTSLQVSVATALVSFDRVFEVLDLPPLIAERPGATVLPAAAEDPPVLDVEFKNVFFRYPAAAEVSLASLEAIAHHGAEQASSGWTLTDISFHVPPGRLVALVGPSGAGKTTITQLVPRLYDATAGCVRIGDHDVKDLTLESLGRAVGVVTQDAYMFHDTIRANLLYARPTASEDELIDACRAARILDTINALPQGLDTMVGERGHRLSGGEKQRLALARLLLKAPPIIVLDEATAHLDSESEQAIQRALQIALKGRTCLVIAHRLSTIRGADEILVVDAGRIRERGTHSELLALNGLYAELYRTQFEEGEPAMNVAT
jgi:ATP-binding cassette subfamily B protein